MSPKKVIIDTSEETNILKAVISSVAPGISVELIQKDLVELITQACEFASDLYERQYFSMDTPLSVTEACFSKPIDRKYLTLHAIKNNLDKIAQAYTLLVFKIRQEFLSLNQEVSLGLQKDKRYCTPFGFHTLLDNGCIVVYTLNYPAFVKER